MSTPFFSPVTMLTKCTNKKVESVMSFQPGFRLILLEANNYPIFIRARSQNNCDYAWYCFHLRGQFDRRQVLSTDSRLWQQKNYKNKISEIG